MAKGDAAQLVTENNKHKKSFREKLEDDNISGSVEKDAKIGLLIAAGMAITIGGVAATNGIKRESSLNTLTHTLVVKAPQVTSFTPEYVSYYPNETFVGGVAEYNKTKVDGYFTIEQGLITDESNSNLLVEIGNISYDNIQKITQAAKEANVTFTEGKLADKTNENVM